MQSLRADVATPSDINDVFALLSAAGDQLAARGYHNWIPAYPRERVRENIEDGVAWVVRDGEARMVAAYSLRPLPTHHYVGIPWTNPDAIARYLNRFAVHPRHQRIGVGRWCLQQVATQCAQDGAAAVRCDVLQANVPLRRFYERNGYAERGSRFHSGWLFAVYEQVLTTDGGR